MPRKLPADKHIDTPVGILSRTAIYCSISSYPATTQSHGTNSATAWPKFGPQFGHMVTAAAQRGLDISMNIFNEMETRSRV